MKSGSDLDDRLGPPPDDRRANRKRDAIQTDPASVIAGPAESADRRGHGQPDLTQPVIREVPAAVARAYGRHLRGRPLEASLAATAAYFVTLAIVRLFTMLVRGADAGYVSIAGVHVHHLVFGVAALLIAGLFALDDLWRIARSILFGIGAALVLDEFALLVFLKDVYWLPQGALSVAALVIGLVALIVNMWRGRVFLADVGAALQRHL